jgi:hypothetical protein
MVALANATTNGFPMIQISGSSDRAIVDLQQGDYKELDQMNAAKPHAKAAYRIDRPEDIGIGVARAIRAAVSGLSRRRLSRSSRQRFGRHTRRRFRCGFAGQQRPESDRSDGAG